MNIKKALEKVSEWQAAAGKLKQALPQGDLVLSTWFTSLQEFKKDLPVLHKLANDALKVGGTGQCFIIFSGFAQNLNCPGIGLFLKSHGV